MMSSASLQLQVCRRAHTLGSITRIPFPRTTYRCAVRFGDLLRAQGSDTHPFARPNSVMHSDQELRAQAAPPMAGPHRARPCFAPRPGSILSPGSQTLAGPTPVVLKDFGARRPRSCRFVQGQRPLYS